MALVNHISEPTFMELKEQHIVIFSLFRFDADIESTAFYLAREFAKRYKVLYFDHPYTFNDYIKRFGTEPFKRRKGLFSLFSDHSIAYDSHLEIFISPILLSIHFLPEGWLYRRLLQVNEWLIRTKIRYILKKRKIENYVFINSFNFHYPGVANGLAPSLKVYQCLDPIIGSFDGKHGRPSERQLVEKSDLVLCSAKQLYDEKKRINPNTYFVPNAADIAHSQKALDPGLSVSKLISDIDAPIIGYFGSIDHRMDFVLLENVARQHPNKQFVFVGPVNTQLPRGIEACDNVHFKGKVPYEEMPSVLKGFDVAMIPFQKDDHSATVFPLKLFEYLGAGKPVIATDFNEDLKEFTKDTVYYCTNADEFSEKITLALTTDSEAKREQRTHLAAAHTWEHRANTILQILSEMMAQKAASTPLNAY